MRGRGSLNGERAGESLRLLVIVVDSPSALIAKGELTARYYNPGGIFDEVHIAMTSDDRPDPEKLQATVGDAKLVLHNLPGSRRLGHRTLGWRPRLLNRWAQGAVDLAQWIQPHLVRCHAAHVNAYAAHRVKRAMGVPYVVSLHTLSARYGGVPAHAWAGGADDAVFPGSAQMRERLIRSAERAALRDADAVIAVYRSIVPYLERLGVTQSELAYNVLNAARLREKRSYQLGQPVRLLCVGRHIVGKEPDNVIRALDGMPGVELTVVGDGPRNPTLRQIAAETGVEGRVHFESALPNDELCRRLPQFDIFVGHSDYREMPKAFMEPMLVGLPLVVNRRRGKPVEELGDDRCVLVENTAHAYRDALAALIADPARRARLGGAARAYALDYWDPVAAEHKIVEIYRRVLGLGVDA